MKATKYLIAMILGVIIVSCADVEEKTAEELLKNPAMEEEIYSAILADTVRFEKLVERMMYDESSRAMLMRNSAMVKMICSSDKMDSLMNHDIQLMESMTNNLLRMVEKDSVVCDKTCAKMMESDQFRKRIMEQVQGGHMKTHETK